MTWIIVGQICFLNYEKWVYSKKKSNGCKATRMLDTNFFNDSKEMITQCNEKQERAVMDACVYQLMDGVFLAGLFFFLCVVFFG